MQKKAALDNDSQPELIVWNLVTEVNEVRGF